MERKISTVLQGERVTEGAGVRLKRIFGYYEAGMFDPFLLFDDFSADRPQDFLRGFPWHPHRGIETITYVLAGDVEHGDSLGNKGVISNGDMQWMTAGSGIIHQEMPKGDKNGIMRGFQLWANLPAAEKMTTPKYRGLSAAEIPEAALPGGVRAKIIAGSIGGVDGPVVGIAVKPSYFDVAMPAGADFQHHVNRGDTVFIYLIEGEGTIGDTTVKAKALVLFDDGDSVTVRAGSEGMRFLFVSGKPLSEPIAWRGPIVMNTDEEIKMAFRELDDGTFIKKRHQAE